jgi:hypothetical protein
MDDEKKYVLCKEICRICLTSTNNAVPCIDIVDKFKFCTEFDIRLHHAYYPAFICSDCNFELETCCTFLEKSKKAENILTKIYDCSDEDEANQVFIDLTNVVEQPVRPVEYVKLEIEPLEYVVENAVHIFEDGNELEFDGEKDCDVQNGDLFEFRT